MKTNNQPLVSVIMIVQNGERFIRQALKSIFDQDYQRREIIVVHGKSYDATLDILHQHDGLTVIQQEKPGISEAYNMGIKAANGDHISFLSFDDIWTPDKLTTQIAYLEEHPKIMFTNCHTTYFLEPGNTKPEGIRQQWLEGSHPARIMETLVARKKVFDVVGYFNPALTTAEDVDWYNRAAHLKVPSFMIEKVLLNKRIHGKNSSMQVNQNNKNLLFALREAVKRKKSSS